MDVKEINFSYTFLKSLPNYENVRIEAGVTMTVEPGEDPEAVFDKARDYAKKQIKRGLDSARGGF